jgi:hypothetical protein
MVSKREFVAQDTGRFPMLPVYADTLSEAYHKAAIVCYERGIRIETPKHQEGMELGFDAHMPIHVAHPDQDPMLHKRGLVEDPRGIMQYILEVTHGIHNHWKRDPNNPNDARWNYTYNERFAPEIPFALGKIRRDFRQKGRISGRDYFFSTWSPMQDSILEQDDPPCLQNGQMRFIKDARGVYHLNYITGWRSRDLAKAWNENNIAQVALQRLLAAKVSDMLGLEVRVGAYIDTSSSLHLYGLYFDRDNLQIHLEAMRSGRASDFGMSFEDYVGGPYEVRWLKRLIAAQSDAEARGHGTNLPEEGLRSLGYNLDTFAYPKDWDSWSEGWDQEPDVSKLRG